MLLTHKDRFQNRLDDNFSKKYGVLHTIILNVVRIKELIIFNFGFLPSFMPLYIAKGSMYFKGMTHLISFPIV